jgi:uncharacterized protein YcfJ
MKRKTCIASTFNDGKSTFLTLSVVLAALVLVVNPANASGNAHTYAYSKAVYDYARVLSVEPNIRYVTITTPVKECWDDVEYHTARQYRPAKVGKTLFGALLGGVIGHQIGSGSGNDAATVAGTLIGAAVANQATRNEPAYHTSSYSTPVRRCETTYQSHEEERIDGYDVIYAYHGRKYATTTPHDPGKKMRIRVDVRPAQ